MPDVVHTLVAELEERNRIAVIECAELRASTAGTDAFERIASLARLLERTQKDLGSLRTTLARRPRPVSTSTGAGATG